MLAVCGKCNITWTEEDENSAECPLCKAKAEIEELKKQQMDESDLFDLKNQIGEIIETGNAFSVVIDALEATSSKMFNDVDLDADVPEETPSESVE